MRALAALQAGDDEQGALFEELSALVRAAGAEAVEAAARMIDVARHDDPLLAWALLYTLDRSEVAEAVELYVREALRPIERRREEEGCYSDVDVQGVVAIEACEALGRRVGAGDQGAMEGLLSIVSEQASPVVRITAARAAYLADQGVRERLEEALASAGVAPECLDWPVVPAQEVGVEITESRRPPERPGREPLVPPDIEGRPQSGVRLDTGRMLRPLRRRGDAPVVDGERG